MDFMRRGKQQTAARQPQTATAPPSLPRVERAFFDMLLQELCGGVQEAEQALRKSRGDSAITESLQKSARVRQTIAYAQALLRMDACPQEEAPQEAPLPTLLNLAATRTRRAFLYAGTALRRASEEPPVIVNLPKEAFLFLLEEMLGCCLRCAPQGKNLYAGIKEIGPRALLSLRTEGPALLQAPLIPLLPQEPAPGEQEDYGFALCQLLAARLGCALRWEADGAGVRMFLELRAQGA